MEKRLILAVTLSVIIIMAFQYLFVKPVRRPIKEMPAREERAPVSVVKEERILPKEAIADGKEVIRDTGKAIVIFSSTGGAIKEIRLKDYKDDGDYLALAEAKDPRNFMLSIEDPANRFSLNAAQYDIKEEKDALIFSLAQNQVEVTKRYIIHNTSYIIELQIYIKNNSTNQKELSYRITGGSGIIEHAPQDKRFIEVMAKINGTVASFKKPKDGRVTTPGIVEWAALKNKYFTIILKPFVATKSQFCEWRNGDHVETGVTTADFSISPQSSVEHRYILYAGPSQIATTKKLGHGFEESVTYGFFGPISKILLWVMGFLYSVVHSWGFSIILLSVFLNLVLSPLTFKSFSSMQKMHELHPQMEKLKAQYKDNPQRLNKEIMELYKKYNINPFSGCLPMLLQMPIFIALYNALIRSIELKGTSFLWIRDLSLPDAVKIPVTLPLLGNHINILPLLMVGAMVIQQKISTKTMGSAITDEQRQQQQMMLILMPIIFGFIFYNMPSGLVLYWLVNTIITTFEQRLMFKSA